MLRQMERSAIQLLAKRGKSQRQIAQQLGYSRTTVARVLAEPVTKEPARRVRSSIVDPYRSQIEQWLKDGLSIVRMLELARTDPEHPFGGGRSTFNDRVRAIRTDQQRAAIDVAVRFEGLPGEYLQVDWGEVRRFPFTHQEPATRYCLCCRLKYSRFSWLRWTDNMRQETLLRGLVDCFRVLGFVPWVLIFDNMKTVTTGRDAADQPVWHPALLQLAAEFDFHPEACAIGRGNQKGTVESLVKWVKGNFLPGRDFADDADLAGQGSDWTTMANTRPSDATGIAPIDRLATEAATGGALPPTAHDYGFLQSAQVSTESLVHLSGNAYSVPVAYVGTTLTARMHQERMVVFHDTMLVASHRRSPDGAGERIVDPAHFQPVFGQKPRAQVMLYRDALLRLGDGAAQYISEVSHRRRDHLREEMLGIYALLERHGADAVVAVMKQAAAHGAYGVEYLEALLPPTAASARPLAALPLAGVPAQDEIDRALSLYEAFVTVSAGGVS
jgi:transposase